MGFETLETVTRGKEPPTAKVTYLRGINRKTGTAKEGAKPTLKISIPTTICGLAKAKIFQILIGKGGDAGKLRISGCKSGVEGIKPSEFKHALTFNFGYVPSLGDDVFDERCPVRKITDDVFEIDVKASWFTG
jgi:hypothetical protein